MSRLARVLLAALLSLPLLVGLATPASAHAALLSTDPEDGVVLEEAPGQVTLRFNQPVGTTLGAVRVLSPDGERVDDGQPMQADGGKTVSVGLVDPGAEGTYVLTWRVMSQDSHAVSGVSTFSVGRASTPPAGALEAADSGAGTWLTVARLIGFTGLVLLVGLVAVLLLVWPQGRARHSTRVLASTAVTLAAVGGLAGLLLQGPNAAGLPVSRAMDAQLLGEVLGSRYGQAHVARLALLAVAAVGVALLLRSARAPGRTAKAAAVALGVPLLVTWPLSGHAAAGDVSWLAVPADTLHLAAVGAWTGGLVVLVVVLLRRPVAAELSAALPRWSRLATVAVLAMVVTGLFASWREVGGVSALTGTTYGRLLVAKVCLVLFMLVIGAGAKAWISRHYTLPVVHAATAEALDSPAGPRPQPSGSDVGLLRRRVVVEAALAAVVLSLTAVLVETPPARSAYAEPLSTVEQLGPDSKVQIDLDSAVVGVNTLHVYLTGPGGKAFDVPEVTARLSRPDGESLTSTVERKSLGHYETRELAVPYRGTWRLDVTVRTSEFDAETATITTTFR